MHYLECVECKTHFGHLIITRFCNIGKNRKTEKVTECICICACLCCSRGIRVDPPWQLPLPETVQLHRWQDNQWQGHFSGCFGTQDTTSFITKNVLFHSHIHTVLYFCMIHLFITLNQNKKLSIWSWWDWKVKPLLPNSDHHFWVCPNLQNPPKD